MKCRGLLADENLQGYLPYLVVLLDELNLSRILESLDLQFVSIPDLKLEHGMSDRALWNFCQAEKWVLCTEDRNDDGSDSLERVMIDVWTVGLLPVHTVSKKSRFARDRRYATQVANDIASVLFVLQDREAYCDRPRIYVPMTSL